MHFRDCARLVHNNRINIGYNDTFSVFSKRQDNAPKRNFAVTLCHTPKQTVGEALAVKGVTLCYTRLLFRLGVVLQVSEGGKRAVGDACFTSGLLAGIDGVRFANIGRTGLAFLES